MNDQHQLERIFDEEAYDRCPYCEEIDLESDHVEMWSDHIDYIMTC